MKYRSVGYILSKYLYRGSGCTYLPTYLPTYGQRLFDNLIPDDTI